MKIKTAIALLIIICFSGYASIASKPVSGQFGFIENKGQITDQNYNLNPSVLYLYNGNGLHVQLKQTGFSYEVWKVAASSQPLAIGKKTLPEANSHPDSYRELTADTIFTHRIDISLVNSNPNGIITASQPASDYINYYTTGTSEAGVTNVHHYKKILYQNIYNNIDIEFILNDEKNCGNFKYNFIIHPNGNPNDIQLKFDGANNTSLTNDGHIIIETAYGNIDESIPLSYQLDESNQQQSIAASFITHNSTFNIYGLSVGKYDSTKTLVIDPFPSTYFGGSSNDGFGTMTTDNTHNIIACGSTGSTSSIATSGAYQTYNAGLNGFISKFNSTGSILWSTYFGGTLQTSILYGHCVATDALNNIFITGTTGSSTNIATTGTYQSTYSGYGDAFLAKFDSLGNRLWGSYFGGSGGDQARGIVIDRSGNLLIGGLTTSTSSIATGGAFQTTHGGGSYDGFIAKFNSSGTALLWATYYGGSGGDQGHGIATDLYGNIYLAGLTYSTTGISSSGSWQSTYGGGAMDAFFVKFDSLGNRLWGTYYGQDHYDAAYAIGLDVIGNVVVTGLTNSPSGFTSSGAFHPTYHGGTTYGGDAFILKFTPSGTRIWATYFGGTEDECGRCLAFDYLGNIFLTGETSSTDSISTAGAFQTTYSGGLEDAFIVKFDSVGTCLWATYFGDSLNDQPESIVVEWNGEILITGGTNSTSRIANSAGYQTVFAGGPYDGFIASFNTSGSLPVQLMSFDAKAIGNWQNAIINLQVLCTWQTASEVNNDYFEIQRSVDGSQPACQTCPGVAGRFKAIGKVKGNGTSNMVNSYQFTDVSAPLDMTGTLYYRLKQVDFDGKSTLSDVRVVNLKQPNNDWNIYPNPTTNELHIETTGTEKFDVQLFDITGKKVMENILFTNTTNINTSSLYQGMYFVRITDADGVLIKTQKVAVVR